MQFVSSGEVCSAFTQEILSEKQEFILHSTRRDP